MKKSTVLYIIIGVIVFFITAIFMVDIASRYITRFISLKNVVYFYYIVYGILGVSIYINILLLIERNKLLNTEEFKRKRVAKLQDKIDNIKRN
jgi:hypothetical protein